jgi:hypothetical protein
MAVGELRLDVGCSNAAIVLHGADTSKGAAKAATPRSIEKRFILLLPFY